MKGKSVMAITVKDINEKVFTKQVRGYSIEEVDDFLDELAEQMEVLIRENRSLMQQLEEAKEKAAGVLPEELENLMDPSVFLEAIGEDDLETIEAMGESAGVLLTTVSAESYEEIYNSYAEKLRQAEGKLVKEYDREAKGNLNGMEGLAEIANAKVKKLAEIDAEGIQALASFMYAKDPSGYENYQAWAGRLYDVYSEESGKIYDAYLSSFGG
jgi:DivIVA domain-containing protein